MSRRKKILVAVVIVVTILKIIKFLVMYPKWYG